MIAGLDETTIAVLLAVTAGGGVAALLAAWVLWRSERAAAAIEPAANVAAEAMEPARAEAAVPPAASLTPEAAATMPHAEEAFGVSDVKDGGAATATSKGGLSRVELFGRGGGFAEVQGSSKADQTKPAPAPVETRAPVESEIVLIEGHVPPVDMTDAVPGAEPVLLPVARRRPRPASELAEAGQTPEVLLARAHGLLAAGSQEEAAVQLRACARLASRLKEPAIEAVARLELGDLCQASGDMTTACEHWQIARLLYGEIKKTGEQTSVIKRMEKAGCPTDWVLTKF